MANRYVLGVNAYDHDTSACLLRDGHVVAAINKERLTRHKNDSGFYEAPALYCCLAAGITLDDVDLIVRNSYLLPIAELEARFRSQWVANLIGARERRLALQSPLYGLSAPRAVDVSHHVAHAYSAFACSPFERGAVMVVDGVGGYRVDMTEPLPDGCDAPALSRESESYYRFHGSHMSPLKKVWLPPHRGLVNDEFTRLQGIGAFYSRISEYIFGHWNRCGEVMGLAPYGRDALPPFFRVGEDEALTFAPWPESLCHPYDGDCDEAWAKSPHMNEWRNVAWRVQRDTEDALIARARWLHEQTGERDLCIAGGVALNCVANGRIANETPFERVWIQPASGDDGIALGAALYGHLAIDGGKRDFVMRHPYLGVTYDDARIRKAFRHATLKTVATVKRADDVCKQTATRLARGAVVGWCQGGSEFGPRALGNRSLLADPRDPKMTERLNRRVKHRQAFRPFAPAVLAEHADTWFEGPHFSPFMLLANDVRPDKRTSIPSVTHVDGTARVQIVSKDGSPRFHALLTAFFEETGCPVLINTSFNIRGEPIVETPEDALRTFLGTAIDVLVFGDTLLEKRAWGRRTRKFFSAWFRTRDQLSPSS